MLKVKNVENSRQQLCYQGYLLTLTDTNYTKFRALVILCYIKKQDVIFYKVLNHFQSVSMN